MGRKLAGVLLLAVCLLGLGGCVFGSVDEMYALPKASEAYVNLQAKINVEKGNAEYIAPLSGENRQTIQLMDVDGDGIQEAVAFFRDSTSETPLKILIFKQDSKEDYQVYARIEGMGSEIESIDYLNLTGSQAGCDILVSWQVSASVHTLVGYSMASGAPVEIMRSGYGRHLAADLDRDGLDEIVLTQAENGSPAHWRIEYYDGRDGVMELISSAPLSEGATDISSWTAGSLVENVPALFVTSYFGKDVLVTDVFCLSGGELKNISLDPALHRSRNTFHYYAGVSPADMNQDGVTEVPVAMEVPSYGDSTVDTFWWLQWMDYRADGTAEKVMTTYHGGDGWYIELPDSWEGAFSMNRQESSTTGVRSVTFARGVDTEESRVIPFLTISSLVGADRGEQARIGGRFILYADTTTLYTAELLSSQWDCGLTQQELEMRFHSVNGSWSYS